MAHIGFSLILRGDFRGALGRMRELQAICDRTGTEQLAIIESYCGFCEIVLGEDDGEAFTRMRRALGRLTDGPDVVSIGMGKQNLGEASLLEGRWNDACRFLREARALREEHRLPQDYLVLVYPLLGLALIETLEAGVSARVASRAELGDVARRGLSLTNRRPNHRALALLVAGCERDYAGDRARAGQLFTEALTVAATRGQQFRAAQIRYYAGRLMLGGDERDAAGGWRHLADSGRELHGLRRRSSCGPGGEVVGIAAAAPARTPYRSGPHPASRLILNRRDRKRSFTRLSAHSIVVLAALFRLPVRWRTSQR